MTDIQISDPDEKDSHSVLISVDLLASMIDLSPRTVWRQLSAGRIPSPVRIGANVRWRKRDIIAWIADGYGVGAHVEEAHRLASHPLCDSKKQHLFGRFDTFPGRQ